MKIENKSTIEYLTLLSTDCAIIENLHSQLTNIIFLPIKTFVVLAILIDQAGFISILAGLLVFIVFSLVLCVFSRLMVIYR